MNTFTEYIQYSNFCFACQLKFYKNRFFTVDWGVTGNKEGEHSPFSVLKSLDGKNSMESCVRYT